MLGWCFEFQTDASYRVSTSPVDVKCFPTVPEVLSLLAEEIELLKD
jgi:hypothetical protein